MFDYIRVASGCPKTDIANIDYNVNHIKKCIDDSIKEHVKILVLPELCITSYTCEDLFLQSLLLKKALDGISDICEYSYNKDILIAIGAPIKYNNCIYNCAIIINDNKILGIVPKTYLPNYNEFYEKRWFTSGKNIKNELYEFESTQTYEHNVPFGTDLIFEYNNIKIGFEICEDLWSVNPPSNNLCLNGANIICNLSASNNLVSKSDYRKQLIKMQSSKCICAYVYSSSGIHESTNDLVFGGDLIISENGKILNYNNNFQRDDEIITSIIDIEKLNNDRTKNITFRDSVLNTMKHIQFKFNDNNYGIFDKKINKMPFVPNNKNEQQKRCEEIFNIQVAGLSKRIEQTNIKKAIIGISGGLDSTLSLLVIIKCFDLLNINRKNIITITMPGFGTTNRTYNNSIELCKKLNTNILDIDIKKACIQHLKDINHAIDVYDTTYENVQARERTQILMDIANQENGLVIGTGDLSEMALGYCTYNADHMSMYNVNCSIPKTLVKYLIQYIKDNELNEIKDILNDILNTPISPELLPNKNNEITQKTQNIIGPYELHDFFLYHFIRNNFSPNKILFLANKVFNYKEYYIKKYLIIFITRFFKNQYKRTCVPNGPKVGAVSLSPRNDWRMPSDATVNIWLNNLK